MENVVLLRPLITQSLFKAELTKEISDFKSWVSSGQYLLRDVPNNKTLVIETNNDHAFSNMLTFDICRTATAAFETMENIWVNEDLPKSYGWLAIKCYYAAFFSAHAIMRCFGYTCSQLERGHVSMLNDYCSAVGLSSSIRVESGYFCGHHNAVDRMLTLKKMSSSTHEETWRWLLEFLENLSINVLNVNGLSVEKRELSAKIDDLILILKDGGRLSKGNYLSQFRNAINYRHEYNAWHPYGRKPLKTEKIISMIKNWRNDTIPSVGGWKESTEAYNFFYACVILVNFCHSLISLMNDSSESKSNLYARWPNKFLQTTLASATS